ncbi:MAG: PAS domain S-box protein [Chloroflexi bacterium]|nr:PAS domain S-box protein [Chloroflexota bacterium]
MSEPRASILIAQSDSAADLSSLLAREGYHTEQSRDARLLVSEYSRLTPTLIVLDSALPEGDSFALCARLRESSSVPILMLLPDSDDLIERAYQAGASDVLIKPIRAALLTRRIAALIEKQEQTEQSQSYEKRWEQVFERNRAIQLLVNPKNGQIVDANPAACVFYGYSREAFRHKLINDLDVTNPSENNEEGTLFNFRHRTASGQVRDVKVLSNPIDYDGQMLLYLLVYDISKRRRGEATPTDPMVLADALRNTAAALSSTLDQNEVLDRILEQVNLVVPSECANIMLIEAGLATVARSRGYEAPGAEIHPSIDAVHLKVNETATLRWMIENNRALAIPNIAAYPDWIAVNDIQNWLQSYVAAPIRIGNYVIGFLNIDSSIPNSFSAEDADHLQIFADQAAIAIRNARLFDRVRRQATEMERRVLQRTAELEYERGQMSAILDAMTEGVAYTELIGGELQVRYINQALVQMMGYSQEEWTTYSLKLLRSKEQSDEEFKTLVALSTENLLAKGFWRNETLLMRKDGTEFDAITISTAVIMPGSRSTGAVTVIRDVSKEKALQQQKERFVAYASHELRTPITNLKTRLYLMRRQPERMEGHMRVLEHVTDRMKRLVEDLLDVSRFERGVIKLNFENVALQNLISMLVQIQQPEAERKQLQLICSLPDAPLYVHADTERLAQVITNLLTNAINYTPAGGKIDVRLSKMCDITGALAQVEIEDSGIGISEEHLPHIFQPFYRVISQVEGTGLGLSITKEIVELHGGEIEVHSQIGAGSNFCFWLPLIESDQENHAHTD